MGRARFLPDVLQPIPARLAIFAVALSVNVKLTWDCAAVFEQVNSGVMFSPVEGIATTGPFAVSRNPLYVVGVVTILPSMAILFDCKWFLLFAPLFYLFIK